VVCLLLSQNFDVEIIPRLGFLPFSSMGTNFFTGGNNFLSGESLKPNPTHDTPQVTEKTPEVITPNTLERIVADHEIENLDGVAKLVSVANFDNKFGVKPYYPFSVYKSYSGAVSVIPNAVLFFDSRQILPYIIFTAQRLRDSVIERFESVYERFARLVSDTTSYSTRYIVGILSGANAGVYANKIAYEPPDAQPKIVYFADDMKIVYAPTMPQLPLHPLKIDDAVLGNSHYRTPSSSTELQVYSILPSSAVFLLELTREIYTTHGPSTTYLRDSVRQWSIKQPQQINIQLFNSTFDSDTATPNYEPVAIETFRYNSLPDDAYSNMLPLLVATIHNFKPKNSETRTSEAKIYAVKSTFYSATQDSIDVRTILQGNDNSVKLVLSGLEVQLSAGSSYKQASNDNERPVVSENKSLDDTVIYVDFRTGKKAKVKAKTYETQIATINSLVIEDASELRQQHINSVVEDNIVPENPYQPQFLADNHKLKTPYVDIQGKEIEGAYVVFDREIGEENIVEVNAQTYLEFFEKLLNKAGYNVEIQTGHYRDTTTGKLVTGSILVDKDDPEIFYHFIINGHIPNVEHGEDNPFKLLKPNADDYVRIIQHRRNFQDIDSPEFTTPDPRKLEQCYVESERVENLHDYENMRYLDVVRDRLGLDLKDSAIRDLYNKGLLNISAQTNRGQMGGDAINLEDRVDVSKYSSLEISLNGKYLQTKKMAA